MLASRLRTNHRLVGWILFCLLIVVGPLSLQGVAPAKLIIYPASLELTGSEPSHGLIVLAEFSDGRQVDVTHQSRFATKTPGIVAPLPGGRCVAKGEGDAEIVVDFAGRRKPVSVRVRDFGRVSQPSFRQDILPLLTKAGCNAGGCHGKLAGQNGFRLSLRGYAPEWDIDWLTRDIRARRIDYAFPEESLLLQKPLGKVPHEGGVRMEAGSREHEALLQWIRFRAPGPDKSEPDCQRIEILPGNRILQPGDGQQLLVRAYYPDGRIRDVTWLTQFFSNDETVANVSADGRVRCLTPGETSIRAHFQGRVETVTITSPYSNKVVPREYARRHTLVDEFVFDKLQALRIPPSPECSDADFLRRASLDTIGALPSPEEVRKFINLSALNKRAAAIDQLLERPEFVDYWTLQFADLLQNRKERDHDVRGQKGVRGFHGWLRAQIAAGRSWDALARELLTAKGDVISHPEIGYFITTIGESKPHESELPDSVAQAFLGSRIGCAKCHNHPLEKYTQDDYFHFAAFFSRVSLKRENPEKDATQLLIGAREEEEQRKQIQKLEKTLVEDESVLSGKTGDELKKAEAKLAESRKKVADAIRQLEKLQAKLPAVTQPRTRQSLAPRPLDRSELSLIPGSDVREPLADWIVNSKNANFSGAMVNRLWKHFMGVGLVEPVDDLRASNPPSNPALWKALNHEFVRSGYNIKSLMRLILNSRAYQLSSSTFPGNETDRRFYSHYYARRLPAEVMLDAISKATGVPDHFSGYPLGVRAVQLPDPNANSYFLGLFGRSERVTACACERNGDVTLPQLLHLQNSNELLKKIKADGGLLDQLLKSKQTPAEIIESLFLATLNRPPRPQERQAIERELHAGEDASTAFQDLFWALLNSKEFAFNR